MWHYKIKQSGVIKNMDQVVHAYSTSELSTLGSTGLVPEELLYKLSDHRFYGADDITLLKPITSTNISVFDHLWGEASTSLDYKTSAGKLKAVTQGYAPLPTPTAKAVGQYSAEITYTASSRTVTVKTDSSTRTFTGGPILLLQLIGGGGGGAGGCYYKHHLTHRYSYARAGSGGGGGAATLVYVRLTDTIKLSITSGAGGKGGASGSGTTTGGAGADGGTTTVKFYYKSGTSWVDSGKAVSAGGGKGAPTTSSEANTTGQLGGAGGSAPTAGIPNIINSSGIRAVIIGGLNGSDGGYGGRASLVYNDATYGAHNDGTSGSFPTNGAIKTYYTDSNKSSKQVLYSAYVEGELGSAILGPAYIHPTYGGTTPAANTLSASGGCGGLAPTIDEGYISIGASPAMGPRNIVAKTAYWGAGGAGGYSACQYVQDNYQISCGAGTYGARGGWAIWLD
jgi:hypothetical protein